jgi:2-keto-3-deoxy-L-rhamnonate aldolase RhmA
VSEVREADELVNATRARMLAGDVAVGAAMRVMRTVEGPLAFRTAGFDWVFLDLEHGALSVDLAAQLSLSSLHLGLTPIARVPAGDYGTATRLLDNGAMGMVVPHVDSAATAREIVRALRFAPDGERSVYGGMPQFGFRPRSVAETSAILNRETLVIAMIESAAGVAHARAIAAVPGIDVLFVGATDLCTEMGIPGQFTHARFTAAVEEVIAACHAAGRWSGIGGLYDFTIVRRYVAAGMRFVLAGSDVSFALAGARTVVREFRPDGPREGDSR